MEARDTPVWAGIAMRLRDETSPGGFVLVTMQLVPTESTVAYDREYVDTGSSWGPRRRYLDTHLVTVQVRGRLLGRGDSWDRWRPDDHDGAAGELAGRRGLPGSKRMELPGD